MASAGENAAQPGGDLAALADAISRRLDAGVAVKLGRKAATAVVALLRQASTPTESCDLADVRSEIADIFGDAVEDIEQEVGDVREQLAGVEDPGEVEAALIALGEEIDDILRRARRRCETVG